MSIITFDKKSRLVLSVLTGSLESPDYYETELVGAIHTDLDVTTLDFPYVGGDNFSYIASAKAPPTALHQWDWKSESWIICLEDLKAVKWGEIKSKRDSREFGPFLWNGHLFDGDKDSQMRLYLAALAAQEFKDVQGWSVTWTLFDNSTIELSASDVLAVVGALGSHINSAHSEARMSRARIDSASTVEELDAIDLTGP